MNEYTEITAEFAVLISSLLHLSNAFTGPGITVIRDIIKSGYSTSGEELNIVYTFFDPNEDRYNVNVKNIKALAKPFQGNVIEFEVNELE